LPLIYNQLGDAIDYRRADNSYRALIMWCFHGEIIPREDALAFDQLSRDETDDKPNGELGLFQNKCIVF
jgi:hypothetical protein